MATTNTTTRVVGSKFEATRDLDIAAVAKLVRADIKAAVVAGALPEGKYSVTIERYSMGRSITVRLSSFPGIDIFDRGQMIASERGEGVRVGFSSAAKGIIAQVEAIAEAYNRRETDWASDYSNVRFHLTVDIDSTWRDACERIERLIARGFAVSEELFPTPAVSPQESWLEYVGGAL